MTISVEGKELALLEAWRSAVNRIWSMTVKRSIANGLLAKQPEGTESGSGQRQAALKVGQIDGEAWHQFSQQYNRKLRRCWHSQKLPTIPNFIRKSDGSLL